jgi:formylglycine-generating enzyme required for sulfatase activity
MPTDTDTSSKTASKSWWHTIAGKITALTAVISALSGLLFVVLDIAEHPIFRALFHADEAESKCEPVPRPSILPAGSVFRDCKCCPEMIVLPNGSAISKYEITKEEYGAYIASPHPSPVGTTGNCYQYKMVGSEGGWQPDSKSWKDPGFLQANDEPVVCISWNEARLYVDWLSRITATPYKIPTLDEMGYASGTSWGSVPWSNNDALCDYANVHDEQSHKINPFPWQHATCNDGFPQVLPTGIRQMAGKDATFSPNPYGIFHLIGNVYEWTSTDNGCDTAGQLWIFGGSWTAAPDKAVAAASWCQSREFRAPDLGVRVMSPTQE